MRRNLGQVLASLAIAFCLVGAVSGCGKDKQAAPPASTGGGTTGGGTTGGGTTTDTVTGMDLYTSKCTDIDHCSVDEKPYKVDLMIENQQPNGWVTWGHFNTGDLGHVTVNIPAGTYRLSRYVATGDTVDATATPVTVTVVDQQRVQIFVRFHP